MIELNSSINSIPDFSIQASRARFYCEIKTENSFTHQAQAIIVQYIWDFVHVRSNIIKKNMKKNMMMYAVIPFNSAVSLFAATAVFSLYVFSIFLISIVATALFHA